MAADIFPGARVLEAGAGSGALSCSLLRAIGPGGRLASYERREDFAAIARRNVENFFGVNPPAWELRVADLLESFTAEALDRVVLDMLAPWECVGPLAEVLVPGGVFCAYVATTTMSLRPWRLCASTAVSLSLWPPSHWSAHGTLKAWPYDRGTISWATPDL